MKAQYLRVKGWKRHQHYADRRPPWIKLYQEVIADTESEFARLSECQQWQLVRIWLLISCSDIEDGNGVQIIAYDELWIRRAIKSLKRVEIEVFLRHGLLEVLASEEVDAGRAASKDASAVASKDASADPLETDVLARKPPLTSLEVSEKSSNEDFLFRVWVTNPGLIRHRETYLDKRVRRKLSVAIGKYGRADVAAAFSNYAAVVQSEAHFFEYRWTLADFLDRGLDKFVPEAEPLANFRRGARGVNAGMTPTEIATMFDEEVPYASAGVRALGRGD